jgi:hypothetical protein
MTDPADRKVARWWIAPHLRKYPNGTIRRVNGYWRYGPPEDPDKKEDRS